MTPGPLVQREIAREVERRQSLVVSGLIGLALAGIMGVLAALAWQLVAAPDVWPLVWPVLVVTTFCGLVVASAVGVAQAVLAAVFARESRRKIDALTKEASREPQ